MGAICGIIGSLKRDTLASGLGKMSDVMRFRGPDYKDEYVSDGVGLGICGWHSVSTGGQPVFNEDQSIVAILDGEIYNWRELALRLKGKGHSLASDSDAEVLVHLYEEYGPDFPRECNGIFAAAIWDSGRKTLTLARDHAGSKSLFHTRANGAFLFSSTLSGLRASGLFTAEISPAAVDSYFANTSVPHPQTLFKNVFSMRPGYSMVVDDQGAKEHNYWNLESLGEDYSTPRERFEEEVRALVTDAVDIRMQGDKPVGGILSGGVDSSTICALLQRKLDHPLEVFSIGFAEKAFDDSPHQRLMIERFGFSANFATVGSNDVERLLTEVVRNSDYPLNNASALGTYRCFEEAGRKVKILFEGEAADELFCGAGGVCGDKTLDRVSVLPWFLRKYTFGLIGKSMYLDEPGKISKIRRLAYRLSLPQNVRMLTWLPAFDAPMRAKLLRGPYRDAVFTNDGIATGKHYLDESKLKDCVNRYQFGMCKTYLCNDLLYKNERLAAANGLINRTPFTDYRLMELAFRIPAKYKLSGFFAESMSKKVILRNALRGIIPDEILDHHKTRGFVQPTVVWMRNELKSWVQDILLNPQAAARDIWNRDYVENLLGQHLSGRQDLSYPIWQLIVFELWMREQMDG